MAEMHTPTPWHFGGAITGERAADACAQTNMFARGTWQFICRARGDGSNDLIAMIPRGLTPQGEAVDADAAHIVRCVNAHDRLVAALRRVAALRGAPIDDCDAEFAEGLRLGYVIAADIADAALSQLSPSTTTGGDNG